MEKLIELLNKFEVFDFTFFLFPVSFFPIFCPNVDGVYAELAVGVDRGLFVVRYHFTGSDERGELHAVIGRMWLVAIVF